VKVLNNLLTETGTTELEISTENQQIIKAITIYTNEIGEKYTNMKIDLRNVMNSLVEATSALYKLANGFADLQKLQSDVSNVVP
jgi:hypothetical protein